MPAVAYGIGKTKPRYSKAGEPTVRLIFYGEPQRPIINQLPRSHLEEKEMREMEALINSDLETRTIPVFKTGR